MALSLNERGRSAGAKARGSSVRAQIKGNSLPQPWVLQEIKGGRAWFAGAIAQGISDDVVAARGDRERLAKLFRAERGQFGLIVESATHLVAAADRVTGFPIFLRERGGSVELAADSSVWLEPGQGDDFDEDQAKLFLMAGYCIGRDTLLRSVTRLLPGEFVVIDKVAGDVARHHYYRFEPTFDGGGTEAQWRKRLDGALDGAVTRLIGESRGRRIWLGLSAGHDSRVVLGKLLQHGARGIQTFSYGTPGNMESRVARDLAASLGVPWRFVATNGPADRADYWGGACAAYMMRGGGVHSIAAVTEFFALQKLIEEGELSSDDVVTNGQTGDFLTGGHIPKNRDFTFPSVDQYILDKHFSLFPGMSRDFGKKGILDLMAAWREDYLAGAKTEGNIAPVSAYQAFEWQERQSRFVLNQHRAHDFLGLTWRTPLWDADLMELYEKVPLDLQLRQKLYLDYLKAWNYRNLFDAMRLPYDPWPRGKTLILAAARFAALFGGAPAKEAAYGKLYYFSDYHYLYRLLGARMFLAFERQIRSPASLFALDHLTRVRKALELPLATDLERRFAGLAPAHSAQTSVPQAA